MCKNIGSFQLPSGCVIKGIGNTTIILATVLLAEAKIPGLPSDWVDKAYFQACSILLELSRVTFRFDWHTTPYCC